MAGIGYLYPGVTSQNERETASNGVVVTRPSINVLKSMDTRVVGVLFSAEWVVVMVVVMPMLESLLRTKAPTHPSLLDPFSHTPV